MNGRYFLKKQKVCLNHDMLLEGNMRVYKKVVCQWPPFGTHFPKGDSIYPIRSAYSSLPDNLAPT